MTVSPQRERTAFTYLEEDHYEVARAALKMAEAVEAFLFYDRKLTLDVPTMRLKTTLTAFREAASRVA